MDSFLSDLCFHCTEQMQVAQDPDQEKATAELLTLEQQLQATMGKDFCNRYHQAEFFSSQSEHEATFLQGLRFGAQFMQLLLGS